ncbi:MAG: hypothetical protein WC477_02360 [Patescibacteria group bacterium]
MTLRQRNSTAFQPLELEESMSNDSNAAIPSQKVVDVQMADVDAVRVAQLAVLRDGRSDVNALRLAEEQAASRKSPPPLSRKTMLGIPANAPPPPSSLNKKATIAPNANLRPAPTAPKPRMPTMLNLKPAMIAQSESSTSASMPKAEETAEPVHTSKPPSPKRMGTMLNLQPPPPPSRAKNTATLEQSDRSQIGKADTIFQPAVVQPQRLSEPDVLSESAVTDDSALSEQPAPRQQLPSTAYGEMKVDATGRKITDENRDLTFVMSAAQVETLAAQHRERMGTATADDVHAEEYVRRVRDEVNTKQTVQVEPEEFLTDGSTNEPAETDIPPEYMNLAEQSALASKYSGLAAEIASHAKIFTRSEMVTLFSYVSYCKIVLSDEQEAFECALNKLKMELAPNAEPVLLNPPAVKRLPPSEPPRVSKMVRADGTEVRPDSKEDEIHVEIGDIIEMPLNDILETSDEETSSEGESKSILTHDSVGDAMSPTTREAEAELINATLPPTGSKDDTMFQPTAAFALENECTLEEQKRQERMRLAEEESLRRAIQEAEHQEQIESEQPTILLRPRKAEIRPSRKSQSGERSVVRESSSSLIIGVTPPPAPPPLSSRSQPAIRSCPPPPPPIQPAAKVTPPTRSRTPQAPSKRPPPPSSLASISKEEVDDEDSISISKGKVVADGLPPAKPTRMPSIPGVPDIRRPMPSSYQQRPSAHSSQSIPGIKTTTTADVREMRIEYERDRTEIADAGAIHDLHRLEVVEAKVMAYIKTENDIGLQAFLEGSRLLLQGAKLGCKPENTLIKAGREVTRFLNENFSAKQGRASRWPGVILSVVFIGIFLALVFFIG